ncbi:MAG: hypothetical protein Q8J78_02680, partial [Moraxellaceae bacterium]|nr:hypothetical protein [Moraxellaceae bacterium]
MSFRTLHLVFATLLAASSLPAHAVVTYAGTEGVGATVFSAHCTSCHSSTLSGASRSSAPVGVDYNNHTNATSGTNETRAKVRAVDLDTMPPAGPLSATLQTRLGSWVDQGALNSADAEVVTSSVSSIGKYGATFNSTVKENGADATFTVRYSTDSLLTLFSNGTAVSLGSPTGTGGGDVSKFLSVAQTG